MKPTTVSSCGLDDGTTGIDVSTWLHGEISTFILFRFSLSLCACVRASISIFLYRSEYIYIHILIWNGKQHWLFGNGYIVTLYGILFWLVQWYCRTYHERTDLYPYSLNNSFYLKNYLSVTRRAQRWSMMQELPWWSMFEDCPGLSYLQKHIEIFPLTPQILNSSQSCYIRNVHICVWHELHSERIYICATWESSKMYQWIRRI